MNCRSKALAIFNQTPNTCRPDLVGFVNGLPLVVIELKKPGVPACAPFDENLTHDKAEIPQPFWFKALFIPSNRNGQLRQLANGGLGHPAEKFPLAPGTTICYW